MTYKPKKIPELRLALYRFRILLEKQMLRLHTAGECETEGIICALYLDTQIALNQLEDKDSTDGTLFSMTRFKLEQYPEQIKS